jgi:hypothetical protein
MKCDCVLHGHMQRVLFLALLKQYSSCLKNSIVILRFLFNFVILCNIL